MVALTDNYKAFMGLYIYLTENDLTNMRTVADEDLDSLFQDALESDKSLMISSHRYMKRVGIFRKRKCFYSYSIYHEEILPSGVKTMQARQQLSASGDKRIVMAYLYGIINGQLHCKV